MTLSFTYGKILMTFDLKKYIKHSFIFLFHSQFWQVVYFIYIFKGIASRLFIISFI